MFEKKSVYHSQLAKAGPIHIEVKSSSMKSKFAKEPGQAGEFYVMFSFDGQEHSYLAENRQCADTLGALKGQRVTIVAEGRNDDARIVIQNPDGTVKPQGAPVARSNAPGGPGQPEQVAAQWSQAATLALDTVHALKIAHDLEYKETPMKPEQFQALVSGLVIYFDRSGVIQSMPGLAKKDEPKSEGAEEPW